MKTFAPILAALAALVLSACYPPTTTHPVGTTIGIKNDPLLDGTWKAEPEPDSTSGKFYYYHFLTAKNESILAVLVPSAGAANDLMLFRLTTARFGKFGIMNARLEAGPESDGSEQPPGSVPVLYRVDAKGKLTLYLLDEDATKEAIRAGRIAGDAGKAGTDDAVISADAPTLDKFFQSRTGQGLFKKPFAVLTKVN